jgi:hypothetical protein
MPSRDEELAPLVRGVFLPEDGEVWTEPDVSQQEFRLLVHYAHQHKLRKADDAVERYRDDPNTDFHRYAAEITNLERARAKGMNFGKIYGMGPDKFAAMIGKSAAEGRAIYNQYDQALPFAKDLANIYKRRAARQGFIVLHGGARRHFNRFAPGGKWTKGAGPCELGEAQERLKDHAHPWHGRGPLYRADARNALNALIQGSAATHTKLWMRACWREGIVPLLQMHDALECSVNSREQAELVARLGCEAVQLDVPMRVDLKFGRTWGDAKHTWEELNGAAPVTPADIDEINIGLAREGIELIPNEKKLADITTSEIPDENFAPAPTDAITPKENNGNDRADDDDDGDDGYTYGSKPHGAPNVRYIYKDAGGSPFMRVTRTANKTFPTQHWQGGRWISGWPATVILYRLPELLAAPAPEPVWITEGEKDADNVAALGLIATTNPGGAKVFQPELAQWLKGKQFVYVLEDNDEAGRGHTSKILAALAGTVPSIATVAFPELPEKEDVSYWLEHGGNKQLLIARAEVALKRSNERRSYIATDLSTVKPRAIRWLWWKHLARGALELLAGAPTVGKSQIQCQYVACATTGNTWPNGAPGIIPCRVIMLTAEDNTDDTLVPRLIAAGADLSRIKELKAIRRNDKEELFLLGEDLAVLEQMIRDCGDVGLVTIDPITAYMGHAKHFDSHRATDVRSQLSPLKTLAERTGIAISAVTHPPKNVGQRALDHFIGSQAFIAAARLGHLCLEEMTEDEGDGKQPSGRYLFTDAKPSIKARQPTLAYRIAVVETNYLDPDTSEPIEAPVIRWEGESALSADEAIAASRPTKARAPNVRDFLNDILAGGKVLQKTVIERGAAKGFSYDQLWRAKKTLRAEDFREKGVQAGPSYWALPQHVPDEAETET